MKKLAAILMAGFALIMQPALAQEHSPLMTIQAEDNLPGPEDHTRNGFRLGGRFGMGESRIRTSGINNITNKLAISGGVAAQYQFTNVLALNTDILLTSVGARSTGATTERDFLGNERSFTYTDRFDFLNAEIPVTGQLTARSGNFFIRGYLGPSLNFKLIAYESREFDNAEYNTEHGYTARELKNANIASYSMIYGFGIGAFTRESRIYFLDFRWNNGLSSLGKINNATVYMNYYTISAGYYF